MALLGPRFAILVWWLIDQTRFDRAFDSFFLMFLGWLVAPWTTIMYIAVFPGGLRGFDWIIMGIGVAFDVTSWTSGGVGGRRRYSTTSGTY